MAFIYQCEQFKRKFSDEKSAKDIVLGKIEALRLRKTIQPTRTLRIYDRANGIYVLRIIGQSNNSRLIVQQYHYQNSLKQPVDLYFLRDYISAGEYEPKWRMQILPQIEAYKYLEINPLNQKELQAAISQYEKSLSEPSIVRDEPDAKLTDWLLDFTVDQEFSVYETQEWVNFFKSEINATGYEGELFKIVKSIVYNTSGDLRLEKSKLDCEGRSLNKIKSESLYIIYEDSGIKLEKSGFHVFLLLIGGFNNENEKTQQSKIEKVKEIKSHDGESYKIDHLSKVAYRAYPGTTLGEQKKWVEVQKQSEKSNLALSPEQVGLLKQFTFPKFINGQAGSGKSEMLYYLFSELCFRKLFYNYEGVPIFLTENEELIDRAMFDTLDKLQNNSYYSDYTRQSNYDYSKYFAPFRQFLLDNFIDDSEKIEEKDKYLFHKYVSFSVFKDKYQNSRLPNSIKSKFPAEISWFIISTYIKGYDSAKELTPDDYNMLPKKDRYLVDSDIYLGVYENVWLQFYKKLRTEGYWDRLDLVQDILNNYEYIPSNKKYTAIVCDEAQDFTRIELQLLIKISKYTDYDLKNVSQVPITFAGDPFQTVNPTGFSLQSLKRLFTQELESQLNFKLTNQLIEQLNYNYRSSKDIVNLANTIQYFRYKFLETSDLKQPQEARKIGESIKPQVFYQKSAESDLKEKLKFAVFLIPCNDGEEETYISQNSWLKNGLEELIVKSAARAKGSEYPRVVLFNYGEDFVKEFGKDYLNSLIEGISTPESSVELSLGEKFKVAFFFNKLYVAITRAKEEIYIVDTSDGIKHFWETFSLNPQFKNVIEPEWKILEFDNLFEFGDSDKIGADDFQSLIKIAQADEDAGITYKDAKKMRDAAKSYKRLGRAYEENNCLAQALEFEGKFKEAGDMYKDLMKIDEASTCYLISGSWSEVLNLQAKATEIKYKIRSFIARIMLNEKIDFQLFFSHHSLFSNAFHEKEIKGKLSWTDEFYMKLSDALLARFKNESKNICSEVAKALESLDTSNESIIHTIGFFYYWAKEYKQAVNAWENLENYQFEEYYRAKSETVSDPIDKIIYLDKFGDYKRVINIYKVNPDLNLADGMIATEIVQNAFLAELDFESVFFINSRYNIRFEFLLDRMRKESMPKFRNFLMYLVNFISSGDSKLKDRYLVSPLFESISQFLSDSKLGRTYDSVAAEILLATVKLIALTRQKVSIPKPLSAHLQYFIAYHLPTNKGFNEFDYAHVAVCAELVFDKLIDVLSIYDSKPGFMLLDSGINDKFRRELELRWLKNKFKIIRREIRSSVLDKQQKKAIEDSFRATVEESQLSRPVLKILTSKFTYEEMDLISEYPSVDHLSGKGILNHANERKEIEFDNIDDINDPEVLKAIIKKLREGVPTN